MKQGQAMVVASKMKRADVMLHLVLHMGVSVTEKANNFLNSRPLELAVRQNLLGAVQGLWGLERVRSDVEGAVDALGVVCRLGHAACTQVLLAHPTPLTQTQKGHTDDTHSIGQHRTGMNKQQKCC